ncbi:hypothetical protein GCM10009790_23680 [Georgenia ruanii]
MPARATPSAERAPATDHTSPVVRNLTAVSVPSAAGRHTPTSDASPRLSTTPTASGASEPSEATRLHPHDAAAAPSSADSSIAAIGASTRDKAGPAGRGTAGSPVQAVRAISATTSAARRRGTIPDAAAMTRPSPRSTCWWRST